ncbi:MAG: hypothetical protein JWQ64_952 [Subtercola sp.]|jgi:hypothetical protein|nr:hypothetical protein [Subtercola sp.]
MLPRLIGVRQTAMTFAEEGVGMFTHRIRTRESGFEIARQKTAGRVA